MAHQKLKANIFILLLFFFFQLPMVLAQENCCNEEACKTNAKELSEEVSASFALLGNDPNNFELREKILDSFKVSDHNQYAEFVRLVKKVEKFNQENPFGLNCINGFIDNEDVLDWLTHFFLKYENVKGLSPEFCKGFGLHFDLNTGVADLFNNTESFSSSTRLLLSYTISKNNCGGKVRLMLGPSVYYQDQKLLFLINPRAEFRLRDIGTDLISIGNIKLITQANFNSSKLITGLGVGAELYNFGAQLLGEYQTGKQNYSIQTGIFYRFKL
ncbi:MAG TPA: hypothetical protein VD908_05220 [Cytophagales bacterium]|nr:hypothetical protein [Cytophagales bacterium]